MIFGKIIGFVLGFFTANIVGAVIGLMVGHFFDKSIGNALRFDFSRHREQLQRLFFETAFQIMGHLAKSDGQISKEEIAQSEALMAKFGMHAQQRKEAIAFFKLGSQSDFQLQPVVELFNKSGGKQHNLPTLLLEILFSVALADGKLHEQEKEILSRTAEYLGINSKRFEQLLSMLSAQQYFKDHHRDNYHQQPPKENELENAYQALGVKNSDNDNEIKRAYRKLMSQHHPDKIIAQGVPEDMVNIATEKAQEIQGAYELIKSARKKL